MVHEIDQLARYAAENTWGSLLPEISLGMLAILLLMLEVFLPRKRHDWIPVTALAGQIAILLGTLLVVFFREVDPTRDWLVFSGLIHHSPRNEFMRLFFLASGIVVTLQAMGFLKAYKLPRVEFYALLLIIVAAMMLLVQANHFIMLFVALETVTVGFYILVSFLRTDRYSLEAGLKYLILGALSSAILLFGIVMLYGVSGMPGLPGGAEDGMSFISLQVFLEANPTNLVALAGAAMVFAGIAFKVGAAPFHVWVADVYQGAPTPVSAFLAVASKTAGFIVLLNLLQGPFIGLKDFFLPLLVLVASASILFGAFGAIMQVRIKRILGLSGVTHAGYLLALLAAMLALPEAGGRVTAGFAVAALLFYLFTYYLASFSVFGVLSTLKTHSDARMRVEDLCNLYKREPYRAGVMVIGLGSLAGVPPLAGFIGKLLILVALFHAQLYWLVGVVLFGVLLWMYPYFSLIRHIALRQPDPIEGVAPPLPEVLPMSVGMRILYGVLAALTILVGLYPIFFQYIP